MLFIRQVLGEKFDEFGRKKINKKTRNKEEGSLRADVITFMVIFAFKAILSYNMKTNIINIGNSQGIILPSMLLRQLKLSNRSTVELEIDNGSIIIKPEPRQGWAEAAKQMSAADDDHLLLGDLPNEFEKEEWTW